MKSTATLLGAMVFSLSAAVGCNKPAVEPAPNDADPKEGEIAKKDEVESGFRALTPRESEVFEAWEDAPGVTLYWMLPPKSPKNFSVSWENLTATVRLPKGAFEAQPFNLRNKPPSPGALRGFFGYWKPGIIAKLPAPSVPFGILNDPHPDKAARMPTNAVLKEMAHLKTLRYLDLHSSAVTDAGLKELARLKNLQVLNLIDTQVTDTGMKEIARLTNLQYLSLGFADKRSRTADTVTDEGLKELASLRDLLSLRLGYTQVTGSEVKAFTGFTKLQDLDLNYTNWTDAGMKELAGLKNLQTLELVGTKVTDTGLKEIAGLTNLQTLNVGNNITDAGLKELAGLTKLQFLSLSGPGLTDAGLKTLPELKSLRTLFLINTKVTDAGATELRKRRPGLAIDRRDTQ